MLHVRLIPARAGKTWRCPSLPVNSAAHPRAGGENLQARVGATVDGGSSPRGRGKPTRARPAPALRGLIPARAGKTGSPCPAPSSTSAHPRAGGENNWNGVETAHVLGSSPRGRGKLIDQIPQVLVGRLIPARAGKTPPPAGADVSSRAHPRAGGENEAQALPDGTLYGSSPRGRGKRADRGGSERWRRLIPARAGKTQGRSGVPYRPTAHPRAGGENRLSTSSHSSSRGSSPRGRGKHGFGPFGLSPVRLIPARAGKTSSSDRATFVTGAHPRAGGENGQDGHDEGAPAGSSPRGRGKLIVSQGMTRP